MIPNWLMQRAYLTPHKIAMSYHDEKWTFLQLKEQAMTVARKLTGKGLRGGQRVALLGPSTPEMVFLIHASMLVGLEIVLLNSRLTKKELAWQLADSAAVAVVAEDELSVLISDVEIPLFNFTDIKTSSEQQFDIEDNWSADRTITVMYTSGTTGFPKGVRQTAGNHTSSSLSSVLNLGLDEEDVWLCVMPLFHISGFSILVRSVIYGMAVRLYEKFDAVSVAEEIQSGAVTRMSVVALMLDKVMREFEANDERAHPTFKTMLAGGGSVPVDYLKRANALKLPVLQTYGMTETSSQTATLSAADAIRKIGSAGKPLFFNQIKIETSDGQGDFGEVMIRGPHVTPGYIGQFEKECPLVDGWLPTGDVGYFDDEGYLYIVDRRADLIISGGENIYPAEIESVLMSHPQIREAGVCGREDAEWGTVPVAFIVSSSTIETTSLEAFCKEQLARFKVPKAFYFVNELPRNASNKLLRRELKQWLE